MPPVAGISIYNHQGVIEISSSVLDKLSESARKAAQLVLEVANHSDASIFQLDEVEVSLVDNATIAGVHMRFMNIPGATDVISFDHGEIHISVETAQSQAEEYGNDFEAEMMLYIIHGLLHLAGHEDASDAGHERMNVLQQNILSQVWRG